MEGHIFLVFLMLLVAFLAVFLLFLSVFAFLFRGLFSASSAYVALL
jgi:hypothetical protein